MTAFEDIREALKDRYLVEAELGEGGSSHVYTAQDLKHSRRVAIKVLKAEVALYIGGERFLREIRVEASLQHPRIVPLFDSGEVIGMPFFVMPLLEGSTLRERIERESQLPVGEAVSIALQLGDALGYAHSKGFIHRDVKPENVLLTAGHVWLADFGIARALREATTSAGDGTATATGVVLGTPAYMSPEQRLGLALDGRSDQYSLACVMYEMLVGRPPNVFGLPGASPARVAGRDGFTPARQLRREVPRALDAALSKALSLEPERRYPTMAEFIRALGISGASTPQGSPEAQALPLWRRRALPLAAAGMLLAAAALYAWRPSRVEALDANALAVLPLAHEGDFAGAVLDGDDCSRLLRDAISRWTGVKHVDDMRVRDVRRRLGRPESVADAMQMARQLGAALAIWGVVESPSTATSGTPRAIRLFLYDVARGVASVPVQGVIDPSTDVTRVFQRLADSLMVGRYAAGRPASSGGSRDVVALRAYVSAHRSLDQWELSAASDGFRQAAERDPSFASAHLWLAQVTAWRDGPGPASAAAASRALTVGRGLSPRDSTLAVALRVLGTQPNEACTSYRAILSTDASDFAAWYGLGECLSLDKTVERDARTRSGFRFRTSLEESVRAYERAVALVPSFPNAFGTVALERLTRWLTIETGLYRAGVRMPDSALFGAWPEWQGDTLASVPYSESALFGDSTGTLPTTFRLALQRNRDRLIGIATRWVASDSSSIRGLETLALAREANDELQALRQPAASTDMTGMAALRRARLMARGEDLIRLGAIRVRFLLKLDSLEGARSLADSLLLHAPPDSGSAAVASWMHGLAMLTGRVSVATAWGRRSGDFEFVDPAGISIPRSLSAAAADAMTYAGFGAPRDSLEAALRAVERMQANHPYASLIQQYLLDVPLTLAWSANRGPRASSAQRSAANTLLNIQLDIASGDSAAARQELLRADARESRLGVEQVWFSFAELNAQLWLALGDTTAATRVLDASLGSVRLSGRQLIGLHVSSAGFVRAMILRSALAQSMGDTTRARFWGSRAAGLWRNADAALDGVKAPVVRWQN